MGIPIQNRMERRFIPFDHEANRALFRKVLAGAVDHLLEGEIQAAAADARRYFGVLSPDGVRERGVTEADRNVEHEYLWTEEQSRDQFAAAIAYLSHAAYYLGMSEARYVPKTQWEGSYRLKHVAEAWAARRIGIPYIANGRLILVAWLLDIPMRWDGDLRNPNTAIHSRRWTNERLSRERKVPRPVTRIICPHEFIREHECYLLGPGAALWPAHLLNAGLAKKGTSPELWDVPHPAKPPGVDPI
ncbi:MAG: hypothetical protein AAGF48_14020 [Pseudomonadota bacterium]